MVLPRRWVSDYWKPFYYVLSEGSDVILVNARLVKNLPGRKTDVSDAAWLAQLGAHGLVKPSFVPLGLAPPSQADTVRQAVAEGWDPERLRQELQAAAKRRRS